MINSPYQAIMIKVVLSSCPFGVSCFKIIKI
jgi:hypothetical protein